MNMNVTRLSPDLLDILSDTTHYPDLERTAARFEQARRTQARLRPGLAESEINFQDSLTLKYKLDELEAYGSDGKYARGAKLHPLSRSSATARTNTLSRNGAVPQTHPANACKLRVHTLQVERRYIAQAEPVPLALGRGLPEMEQQAQQAT